MTGLGQIFFLIYLYKKNFGCYLTLQEKKISKKSVVNLEKHSL